MWWAPRTSPFGANGLERALFIRVQTTSTQALKDRILRQMEYDLLDSTLQVSTLVNAPLPSTRTLSPSGVPGILGWTGRALRWTLFQAVNQLNKRLDKWLRSHAHWLRAS